MEIEQFQSLSQFVSMSVIIFHKDDFMHYAINSAIFIQVFFIRQDFTQSRLTSIFFKLKKDIIVFLSPFPPTHLTPSQLACTLRAKSIHATAGAFSAVGANAYIIGNRNESMF